MARAVEQEPEHRARPGFRTRRDEAAPVPVPPRPHCLGAGAEGREAPAERQEAPAAPAAPAHGPSPPPAMASAPRLALLAAALLCAPGKWERHRERHQERQLAPGTAPGTDSDPAPHPSRRPAGIRSRVDPQPGSILPFPHVRVPPFRRDPGNRGDLTPSSFFPAFPGIRVPHSAGIRAPSTAWDPDVVARGTWDPRGSRGGNLLPIPTGTRRPRDSPSPGSRDLPGLSPRTPDPLGEINSRP